MLYKEAVGELVCEVTAIGPFWIMPYTEWAVWCTGSGTLGGYLPHFPCISVEDVFQGFFSSMLNSSWFAFNGHKNTPFSGRTTLQTRVGHKKRLLSGHMCHKADRAAKPWSTRMLIMLICVHQGYVEWTLVTSITDISYMIHISVHQGLGNCQYFFMRTLCAGEVRQKASSTFLWLAPINFSICFPLDPDSICYEEKSWRGFLCQGAIIAWMQFLWLW